MHHPHQKVDFVFHSIGSGFLQVEYTGKLDFVALVNVVDVALAIVAGVLVILAVAVADVVHSPRFPK